MKTVFEQAAIEAAQRLYAQGSGDNIQIYDDASVSEADGGVWVRAAVFVRTEEIDAAPPPAPVVVAIAVPVLHYVQFRNHYVAHKLQAGDHWTEDDVKSSWESYQRDPAGHFVSKP